MKDNLIHKTAIVHPNAKLANGVEIGPYAVIDEDVCIGESTHIGAHCLITGKTTIGSNCQIFTGAVVGSIPQDKKFNNDPGVSLTIGNNNIFREYVTVNLGTEDGGGKTSIGDDNLFMAYSHVAHDCHIGNGCVLANSCNLAGHVEMEDFSIIGGVTGVHQFVRIGRLAMVGGCSRVSQDIAPFSRCAGIPIKLYGLNIVGLKRSQMESAKIKKLNKVFKILFSSGLNRSNALTRVESEIDSCDEVKHLISFVRDSKRGVSGS